jgi:hypothetical protein
MAARLLERGIYVIGFSYPVVPQGQARIRTQMSAAHSDDDIDRAVSAFIGGHGDGSPRMKALVKSKPEPGLWMEEAGTVPRPGVHDVLIRVKKTSICGTDLHIYDWDPGRQDHPRPDDGGPRVRR